MKRKLTKRVLALLASFAMIFSLLPMTAMAAEKITIYTPVSTIQSGHEYLIVSAQSGTAYALKHNGSAVDASQVTFDGAGNIIDFADSENCVWTISGSAGYLRISNKGAYLWANSYTTMAVGTSNETWSSSANQLRASNYMYAYFTGTSFAVRNASANVYFYEKTEVDPPAPTVESVIVSPDEAMIDINETVNLTATVNGSEGVSQNVTWSSSDEHVVTVSDGVVTGVGAGEATITATSVADDTKSGTCSVTVNVPDLPHDPVAKIGDNYFDTLQEAVFAAGNGDTITVLKNIEGDGLYIPAGKFADIEVTIDLNGFDYDITGTGVGTDQNIGILIESGNKVKFTDVNSNSGGNIRGNVSLETVLQSSGELTLNDVVVYSNKEQPADTDKALYVSGGSVTLEHAAVVARSNTVGYALYVAPAASADVTADTNSYTDGKVRIEVPQGGNLDHLDMTLNNLLARSSDIFEVDPSIDNVMDKVNVTKAAGTNYVIGRDTDYEWKNGTTLTLIEQPPVEAKIYKKVDEVKDGKNYLIVSQTADGNASVMTLDASALGKEAVTIADGKIEYNGTAAVWAVSGSNTGFVLLNGGKRIGAYASSAPYNLAIEGASGVYDPIWTWKLDSTKGAVIDHSYGYAINWSGNSFSYGDQYGKARVYFFEECEPEPEFVGHSLVLTDQIGVMFYMDLSCLSTAEIADSSLTFDLNQMENLTIQTSDATVKDGKYVFTCPTNSLQMADTITATFNYGEGKTVVDEYSVKEYIEYVVANPSEFQQTVVDLAKAIADYGQYAQVYLSGAHGFEVGEGGKYAQMTGFKSVDQLNVEDAADKTKEFGVSLNRGESQVEKFQLKLSLDSETALSVRAKAPADVNVSGQAAFKNNSFDFDNAIVKVTGIKAAWLDVNASITGNADGAFSGEVFALSYANVVLNGDSSDQLKHAMVALYNYYAAVKAYNDR